MFKLFFLALFAGGWALSAAALHVVRTPSNFTTVTIVPKNDLSFDDTYVDARTWTAQDLPKHRSLVRRLITAGKSDALAHVVDAKSHRDVPTQLADALGKDPVVATADAPGPTSTSFNAALAQIKSGKVRPEELAKMLAGTR